MTKWFASFAVGAAGILAASVAAAIQAVAIGTFDTPSYVAVAPGAPTLLFVVEQPGQIQVLREEQKLPHPFLDIRNLVLSPPDPGAGGEQGLLSVAFAPNYRQSGLFYVFFVNVHGNLEIDEFHRRSAVRADRSSRRVILRVPHPNATNHNGGQMHFGADGLLYISTGDGGGTPTAGDPARDLNSLLGKILRIDPLHPTASRPYRIPPTNPFVGKTGRDEIYAYGFRNPWRFAFDKGRIAIGDVGETRQEEVDFLAVTDASGVNFGWPQYEGNLVYDNSRPGPGEPVFPMFVYSHSGGRCAIIGGYVVHDPGLPEFSGRYLYGDNCTGEVRSFVPKVAAQNAVGDAPTGLVLSGLSSFGVGFGGKIYFAQTSGTVSRLAADAP